MSCSGKERLHLWTLMHLTFICRYSGRTRDDPYAPCTHGKLAFGGNHVILAPLDVLSIISHMSTIIYLFFFLRIKEGKRLAFSSSHWSSATGKQVWAESAGEFSGMYISCKDLIRWHLKRLPDGWWNDWNGWLRLPHSRMFSDETLVAVDDNTSAGRSTLPSSLFFRYNFEAGNSYLVQVETCVLTNRIVW